MRVNITTIKKISRVVRTKLIQLTANKFRWFYHNPRELLISVTQRNSCAIHSLILLFDSKFRFNEQIFILLNLFVI